MDENEVDELKKRVADNKCVECGAQLQDYTSKKGFTYKANPDKSVHRVKVHGDYRCVNNWDELNKLNNAKTANEADNLKAREINVFDAAEKKLREEARQNLRLIEIYEEEVKKKLGENAPAAKIGLYVKILHELSSLNRNDSVSQ